MWKHGIRKATHLSSRLENVTTTTKDPGKRGDETTVQKILYGKTNGEGSRAVPKRRR